jgi:hypothetical protein
MQEQPGDRRSVRLNVSKSLNFVETIAPDFSSFPSQRSNFTCGYVPKTGLEGISPVQA